MKKVIYLLSNHGKNKNYVSKDNGSCFGFSSHIKEAIIFGDIAAEKMKTALTILFDSEMVGVEEIEED
ncbi:hypothetical protein IGK74_002425 [Enterococcus sp. AZ150]|uniref:hypothetical protein n=1 Tax=Enterococcus sp. AZ150 TaxID=2774866 RepID=UPI003F203811